MEMGRSSSSPPSYSSSSSSSSTTTAPPPQRRRPKDCYELYKMVTTPVSINNHSLFFSPLINSHTLSSFLSSSLIPSHPLSPYFDEITRYEDVLGAVSRLRKEGKTATEICKILVQDALTKVFLFINLSLCISFIYLSLSFLQKGING